MKRAICILGATGSIGKNTLDVVARHPDRFRVTALTGNHRVEEMRALCVAHRPKLAVMANEGAAQALRSALADAGLSGIRVESGPDALAEAASMPEVDEVMAAIVGAAGLLPTLAAVQSGKRVYLANKECLVMAGQLFMDAVHRHQVTLLPIDSEHNAVFQCFGDGKGVRRILLTASGGPFRETPAARLHTVTPDEACAHPNWRMGRKISVDSATMMNKGLEVIEAHWLFGLPPDAIDVVIHPQSIIHSMVEYVDGSVLAQLGNPDMRTPIAHALAWPERMESGVAPLDLCKIGRLDFQGPDPERFPCLSLAYQALRQGGSGPAILNAANEVAVEAFLSERIHYLDIPALVGDVLAGISPLPVDTLEGVLTADRASRERAWAWVGAHGAPARQAVAS